jgi:AraC family transcriptional regulator of arabinose operon
MSESKYFPTSDVVSSNRILYTPSRFARASLLHLQEIGTLQALKPHTSHRDNLSSFLFFIVLSGEGSLFYEEKNYSLSAGDMVFIDCLKPYSHTTPEATSTVTVSQVKKDEFSSTENSRLWSLRWCHFNGPTLPLIYQKYVERGGKPVFRPEDPGPFATTLDKLYTSASSSDYIRDMKINEQLNTLCTLIMSESWHPEDIKASTKKMSVMDVKAYLDQHYAEHITLDDLSEQFFINKYYLTRVFKEQFGQSINAYLQSVRITHAKQLLRFSDKTVEEIGIECGLGSLHYFSRVFKNIEGVPPSEYRSQW